MGFDGGSLWPGENCGWQGSGGLRAPSPRLSVPCGADTRKPPQPTFGSLEGRPWGQVHSTVQAACPRWVTGLGAAAAGSPWRNKGGQRLHIPRVCPSSDLSQNHLWTWTCMLFPRPVRQPRLVSRSVVSGSLRPLDCSPPGSSVRGILQARTLEWVAISFPQSLLKLVSVESVMLSDRLIIYRPFSFCFSLSRHQSLGASKDHVHQGDFPGGPVARGMRSQCRGPGFHPWSEN